MSIASTLLSSIYTRIDLIETNDYIDSNGQLHVEIKEKEDLIRLTNNYVPIMECDVYCLNYKGFPIAYKYGYTHEPASYGNFMLNVFIYFIVYTFLLLSYIAFKIIRTNKK